MKINKRMAKPISYGGKRNLSDVKFIVIHFTGNKGDTAKNNADFYATGNKREAGAHFYVDKIPEIWESVPMERIAWSVGHFFTKKDGAASYYGKCTNANSVSIEMCDCIAGASWEQMLAIRELVLYIKKRCPNAKTIIRHWDVNGKECPKPMIGKGNLKWKHLHNKLTYNYQYKAKVTKAAAIRSSKGVKPGNKIGSIKPGEVVKISKVIGAWGRLLDKKGDKWQWISLKKVKEI